MNAADLKVLIVEDDTDVREMMQLMIGSAGFDTVGACNGRQALERMREELPCMVLLDLQMPIMDGFEFRRRQLADPRLADVPVVCITAHYDPAAMAANLGVPCLAKPPDFDTVVGAVAATCGGGGKRHLARQTDSERLIGAKTPHFRLEWLMPLEPGLTTHVTLLRHDRAHDEGALATGSGADEAETLLDLWTTLIEQHASADALAYVAGAYTRRTGHRPDKRRELDQ